MLSKSQYIRGLQCSKSLWLYRNRHELRTLPDAKKQAIFNMGHEVGVVAQNLFPDGVGINYSPENIKKNIHDTKELLDKGAMTIYEAAFVYDGALAYIDILHKGTDGWEIYEVKSSTALKDVYLDDAAYQHFVVSGCDLQISKISIVYINNQYSRHGKIEESELFTIADVTEIALQKRSEIISKIRGLENALKGAEPNVKISEHCFKPYECDFKQHCWKHIPTPSVFNLSHMRITKKFQLYDKGIVSFEDIPNLSKLSSAQELQVKAELNNEIFINKENIRNFLESIDGKLGFLDFETFTYAIPYFDNQRPYQQVPFQYSLYISKNGTLEYFDFLAEPGEDPRQKLASQLINDVAICDIILVYNIGFEKRIIHELAAMLPNLRQELHSISDRLVDLMKPFQALDYYRKEMAGSYSIKNVLPALLPDFSYQDLEISDGQLAMQAYLQLKDETDECTKEKTMENLRQYCKLDTLAMAKILAKLQDLIGN